MFFISITKKKIVDNLNSPFIKDFIIGSSIITVVVDHFLSKYVDSGKDFTIIESPFVSSPNYTDCVYSEVVLRKEQKAIEIYKSTISGRPIYYYLDPVGDFYCSTHISMLRKAGVPIEENEKVLPEFFIYRWIMPPNTLYKNIKQVVTGNRLYIGFAKGKCELQKLEDYLPPLPDRERGRESDYVENTCDHLQKTIQTLDSAKDRISVLLSGGLDSSILFKLCANRYDTKITYSSGYPFEDDSTNWEKKYALTAAEAFGTDHNYFVVQDNDYLSGLIMAIQAAELPVHHLQSPLLYLLFKEGLPEDKDIVVSGSGGDSAFGIDLLTALFWCENSFLLQKFSQQPFLKILELVSDFSGRGHNIITSLRYLRRKSPISDPNNIIWSFGIEGDEEWVYRNFKVTKQDIDEDRYKSIKKFEERSIYDVLSVMDLLGDMAETNAIWAKLGESCKKIVYYPYGDINLLNYAYSIPWADKMKKRKNILRGVARQLNIPDFIITRRKRAFSIHEKHWAVKGGVFEPLVALSSKVVDKKEIQKMQVIDYGKSQTLWNIFNYSIWKRLFINGEPLEKLLDELEENSVKYTSE